MWEIFSFGSIPYPGMTNQEVAKNVTNGYKMSLTDLSCDDKWKTLINKCWTFKPENRPRFSSILAGFDNIPETKPEVVQMTIVPSAAFSSGESEPTFHTRKTLPPLAPLKHGHPQSSSLTPPQFFNAEVSPLSPPGPGPNNNNLVFNYQ
jgi:hypothetical protein